LGAPGDKSYPLQLEALLNAGSPRKRYAVVNGGKPTQNTAQLRASFTHEIEAGRPSAVIVLSGGANQWNFEGYASSRHGGWLRRILEKRYSLHTFKLAKLLIGDILAKQGEVSAASPSLSTVLPNSDDNRKGWQYHYAGDDRKAAECLARSVAVDPSNTNSWYGLGVVNSDLRRFGEAEACFKKCVQAQPRVCDYYYHLGNLYRSMKRDDDALVVYEQGVTSDPENRHNMSYHCLAQLGCQRSKPAVAAGAVSFLRRLKEERHIANPQLTSALDLVSAPKPRREIDAWIVDDIGTIAGICKEKKVPVILQNYPFEHKSNPALASAAVRYGIPLVDNAAIFRDLLHAGKEDDYFAPDHHCNAKGYGVMAYNVYAKLKEIGLAGQ
jgi:tetratricopeptide (TPR) repeat protein